MKLSTPAETNGETGTMEVNKRWLQTLQHSIEVCIIACVIADMEQDEPEFKLAHNELKAVTAKWREGIHEHSDEMLAGLEEDDNIS